MKRCDFLITLALLGAHLAACSSMPPTGKAAGTPLGTRFL